MMRALMKIKSVLLLCAMMVLSAAGLHAQSGNGGTQSPFSFGMDARAFSMGNAAVAYPQDASAMFWNPAGMVVVDQKVLGLSMSTLFESTQYQYAGMIIPTLNSGSFGIGVARIGTDGIPQTDWDQGTIQMLGDMSYWWARFSMAYGLRIYRGLSVGASVEVDRMVLGDWSTNGFGLHGGLHYRFSGKSALLKGLNVGLTFENLVSPQLSLGNDVSRVPYTMRFGVAKVFTLSGDNRWLFLADVEKPELVAMRYHIGTEFLLSGLLALRVGYNDGQFTFGGGIKYHDFSIDYATGQLNELGILPWTHRFSLSFHMGATLTAQRAALAASRQQEVESKFLERLEEDRQRRVHEGIRAAQDAFEKDDYFNARLLINSVLRDEPGHVAARALLADIEARESAYQSEREEALLREGRQQAGRQRDIQFIRQRRNEANEAMDKGDVRGAIEAWEMALARDPQDEVIRNSLEQARNRLGTVVTDLIAEARRLIRQEAISEAYKRLEMAKNQAQGNEALLLRVNAEIRNLDREVDFLHNYQTGEKLFNRGEYAKAMPYLESALRFKPSHQQAKEMKEIARALMQGGKREMRDDVRVKYLQGIRLYRNGNYQEALDALQKALELDPGDATVLQTIRGVRKKVESLK